MFNPLGGFTPKAETLRRHCAVTWRPGAVVGTRLRAAEDTRRCMASERTMLRSAADSEALAMGVGASDSGFKGFGEAYFTTINRGDVKAWKKQLRMTLNLVVPVGKVKVVAYDDGDGSPTMDRRGEVVLSPAQYSCLTVPTGLWFGFMGVDDGLNLMLNAADLVHDPEEVARAEREAINYEW